MIIVTVNNQSHLVDAIASDETGTTLHESMEIPSKEVTVSAIASYLQKKKLGTLETSELTGLVSMQTRELTAPEEVIVAHAESQYKLAEAMAMPELINKTFRAML